ncbi:ATP-binding cassette domain-containing protein [bacterium]|jgi:ABC-type transport system, ATPase component|nr:ATP-binding cassette domain-containing protein [bacterium]
MLKVENVTKYYGTNLAVDHLSFTVDDGEIFGLLGSNGAGKTTTFRMIMGLLDATSGKITLDGKKIDYSVTDKIGFVTEERSLLTKMTVKEQIIYYGRLKGLSEKEILKRLDDWLERFQIKEYKNRKIKELSKGNQQKIQFIAAVINEPKLLILDEPFTGLDPINVKLLKEAIYSLQKKGCSIIFSSHQMEHIEQFCEKLVILVKGKTVLEGYLKDIKESYQKKNIFIRGDVTAKELESINGVLSVEKKLNEFEVKIENNKIVEQVFKKIAHHNITKFVVEEASLNEIFIAKVGASYDE